MSFLLRLKSGNFDLDSAFTLEEIVNLLAENDTSFLLSPEWGLELPQISIPSSRLQAFKNGLPTNISMVYGEVFSQNDKKSRGNIFQVYCHGKFIGIGTIRADSLYPEKVLFNG